MQLSLLSRNDFYDAINQRKKKTVSFWGKEIIDDFDYLSDEADAVVFLMTESAFTPTAWIYVMKRKDAIRFCSHEKTKGISHNSHWMFSFSTYFQDWRATMDNFRPDDGRFQRIIDELGINLIYPINS